MEIAIRKATRLEYRPPKEKHLQTLINLTYHKPALIDEILLTLSRRGKENSWIIVFKVLIIVHTLIRQGNGDQTLSRLQKHPEVLSLHRLKEKASAYASIQNLHMYHQYLIDKMDSYRECELDYTKTKGRLRQLTINNGLLKETTRVQKQLATCLSCKFQIDIGDNAISFNAYRLTVEDLLALFQVTNEAVVNILEHYFTLSKTDATLALEIYKRFCEQAQTTTSYLDNARKLEHELFITIPQLNHAPLSLASALEDYLNDDNFEYKRQTIIQEKQQKLKRSSSTVSPSSNVPITQSSSLPPNNTSTQISTSPNNNALNEFYNRLENENSNMLVPYQQQQQQLIYNQFTGQSSLLPQQPIQSQTTGNPFLALPPPITSTPQQQYPIFPINTSLKRSASLSTSTPDYLLATSPLTYNNPNVSLTSLSHNTNNTAIGSNPFRFSTLPVSQYKSHPSQHLPIPINTKNPFAISNDNNNILSTPPLTPVQNTNPFARS